MDGLHLHLLRLEAGMPLLARLILVLLQSRPSRIYPSNYPQIRRKNLILLLGGVFGTEEVSASFYYNCGLQVGSGAAEIECHIESTDPDTDSQTYSHVGVSVYAFVAPSWSAYPSGWTDGSIHYRAFQKGSGSCSGGQYGIQGVQFRATYVAGGFFPVLYPPLTPPPVYVNPLQCN